MKKAWFLDHHTGLICLSGCPASELGRALGNEDLKKAETVIEEYLNIFGKNNYFLEVGHHPNVAPAEKIRKHIFGLGKKFDLPVVATQDIHYLKSEDAEYHDILLAVQTGNKLSDPNRLTLKDDDFSMRSPEAMADFFKDHPEAIANTEKIAARCNVELKLGATLLPHFETPDNSSAFEYLKKLVVERTAERYSEVTEEIRARIDYELGVIEKTGFADYFLIVQDLVNWAKDRGIAVGPGRGSAAGSIISYILKITDIDPIKYALLFERFLNPDRIQMPDIDIDFSDTRRDEVLGYLRERYGENHVAQIITFGTMAARAAIRDVGRALGISYGFCDQLAKLIPFNATLADALKIPEVKSLYDSTPDAKKILDAARHFEGVARHASVHACGTVITPTPLTDYLPLQKAPQDENAIITQLEMHAVEDLGLLKMDLLGLKNLTIIEETIRLIKDATGEKIDVEKLPLDNEKTYRLLQEGLTVGVFQLESSGMQRYLKELRPTELEDIIAMVALYRPGPLEMGMVPKYIARKHGREAVTYLHPKLEPILKNTYGIGIYQEQMMRIARDLGGYSLAGADTLRKAIGKKIKALLDEQEAKLIAGMVQNGIDRGTAKKIWELFPSFARYGFNRSHAACYAMVAYRTAYLKANYPIEFVTALLNADSGDVERISFLISEAKKLGIHVLPPDINKSAIRFAPAPPTVVLAKAGKSEIRFGLAAIKNVGDAIVSAIIEERERGGPFTDFLNFIERVQHKDLNKKSLESFAKCGALDSLGTERNTIVENIDEIIKFVGALRKNQNSNQIGLFGEVISKNALQLEPKTPASVKERLLWEKELLGLYISDHPLNHFKTLLTKTKITPIELIVKRPNSMPTELGIAGIISSIKRIVTKRGDSMVFAKIEDQTDSIEVIVFADTFQRTVNLWKENNIVRLHGKLSSRNGELKLVCENVQELTLA